MELPGAGVFKPVKVNHLSNHQLHRFLFSNDSGATKARKEYPQAYADAVRVAEKRGIIK